MQIIPNDRRGCKHHKRKAIEHQEFPLDCHSRISEETLNSYRFSPEGNDFDTSSSKKQHCFHNRKSSMDGKFHNNFFHPKISEASSHSSPKKAKHSRIDISKSSPSRPNTWNGPASPEEGIIPPDNEDQAINMEETLESDMLPLTSNKRRRATDRFAQIVAFKAKMGENPNKLTAKKMIELNRKLSKLQGLNKSNE